MYKSHKRNKKTDLVARADQRNERSERWTTFIIFQCIINYT